MAIRFDKVTEDEQKLPVVSWEEDRNIFAPAGFGPARVACFIRPDKESGRLMFVAAGSVRHGDFEEARGELRPKRGNAPQAWGLRFLLQCTIRVPGRNARSADS